jgi:Legume lectin domain/PEP-CTERM motif
MKRHVGTGILGIAILSLSPAASQASTITYSNFSSTAGLQLNGNAATAVTSDGTVLRLTPSADGQAGSAFTTDSVSFASASDTFSTFFQFRITNPGGIDPADGIAFVVEPGSNSVGGSGGGIGYQDIPNSLGVEFDTYNNGSGDHNSSNHVGVDINGVLIDTPFAFPYGVTTCDFGSSTSYQRFGCLSDGDLWSVWLDYDGTDLHIAFADNSTTRPADAINTPLNLPAILGTTTAFVGFTSATGAGRENHDIVDWQYTNTISSISGPPSAVPEPASLVLLGTGLVATVSRLRRRRSTPHTSR